MKQICVRTKIIVNTDPQRRCYNGCNYSEELQYSNWEILETVPEERAANKLDFWVGLNNYSVSVGGQRCEYKVVDVNNN